MQRVRADWSATDPDDENRIGKTACSSSMVPREVHVITNTKY